MAARSVGIGAARGAILLALPLVLGATGLTTNMPDRVLAAQNMERAALGLELLSWNPRLARSAQQWADHLAATGEFRHAPEKLEDPEGENLWAGTNGYFPVEARVAAWAREKQYFKRGTFPNNSLTGRIEDVGHYTQMIWGETREVGCAVATGAVEDVLVCRYSDAGNYIGERPF